jgi:3-hydroxyisobutyrate dehydrogenase-like beta-hydroxyacid dehydrogenase
MSAISVLGLGSMGAALARTLRQAGHPITVWNRSPEKMQALVAAGAIGAPSVAAAVSDSPVILVCVDNYAVTQSLLGASDVVSHLPGRIVVQLSTGTPSQARESAAWMSVHDVAYIDGAILGGPGQIGTADAQILFSGPEIAFRKIEDLIDCLGGDRRYLGENIRAAAALDLAWLCQRFGLFLGVVYGAYLCESENVPVDLYATMFPDGDRARMLAQIIHSDDYANPGATLAVWAAALQRVRTQAGDAGLNNEIPEFIADLFERAMAAGHGEEDVAALIKVLRGT